MISGRFSEQGRKNYTYSTALRSCNWMDAVCALEAGAEVGYVDPNSGKLDLEMAKAGGETANPLVSILQTIYRELAAQPEATVVRDRIIKQYAQNDAAIALRIAHGKPSHCR
jgi:hypothetical protein